MRGHFDSPRAKVKCHFRMLLVIEKAARTSDNVAMQVTITLPRGLSFPGSVRSAPRGYRIHLLIHRVTTAQFRSTCACLLNTIIVRNTRYDILIITPLKTNSSITKLMQRAIMRNAQAQIVSKRKSPLIDSISKTLIRVILSGQDIQVQHNPSFLHMVSHYLLSLLPTLLTSTYCTALQCNHFCHSLKDRIRVQIQLLLITMARRRTSQTGRRGSDSTTCGASTSLPLPF